MWHRRTALAAEFVRPLAQRLLFGLTVPLGPVLSCLLFGGQLTTLGIVPLARFRLRLAPLFPLFDDSSIVTSDPLSLGSRPPAVALGALDADALSVGHRGPLGRVARPLLRIRMGCAEPQISGTSRVPSHPFLRAHSRGHIVPGLFGLFDRLLLFRGRSAAAELALPGSRSTRSVGSGLRLGLLLRRQQVEIGDDPAAISRDAGHADMGVTFRIYTHVMALQDGDRDRLRGLVAGTEWAAMGSESATDALTA